MANQSLLTELRVFSLAEGETLSLEDPGSLFLDLQSYRVPPSSSPRLCDSAPASLPLLLWRGRICWGVGVFVCINLAVIVCVYVLMGGVERQGAKESRVFSWSYLPVRHVLHMGLHKNLVFHPGPCLISCVTQSLVCLMRVLLASHLVVS